MGNQALYRQRQARWGALARSQARLGCIETTEHEAVDTSSAIDAAGLVMCGLFPLRASVNDLYYVGFCPGMLRSILPARGSQTPLHWPRQTCLNESFLRGLSQLV
jgi:hypothetical protein